MFLGKFSPLARNITILTNDGGGGEYQFNDYADETVSKNNTVKSNKYKSGEPFSFT